MSAQKQAPRISVSSIPRLSRNVGRSSNIPKPARSSSATTIRKSYLSVCGSATKVFSGTLGRSSSYSNLATPSRNKLSLTPISASKHAKPSDKDWQKVQLQRVRKYFLEVDPNIAPLKPLSMQFYIQSMDYLLKKVDSRIVITSKNYKEAIPEHLQLLKYPYQLKPSVTKQPTVPSNFPYILQIWVWLLDFLEDLENSENIIFPNIDKDLPLQLFQKTIQYMGKQFSDFNLNKKKEDVPDTCEEFINIVAEIRDVDLTKLHAPQENVTQLDAKLRALKEQRDQIQSQCSETATKLSLVRQSNSQSLYAKQKIKEDLERQVRELHSQRNNIHKSAKEMEEQYNNLKERVSKQPHTKNDLTQLKTKIAHLKHTAELEDQRVKQLKKLAEGLTPLEGKSKIESLIYEINGKCANVSYMRPDLELLELPAKNIDNPDFSKDIAKFTEQATILNKKLDTEAEVLEKEIKLLAPQNKKKEKKLTELLAATEKQKRTKADLTSAGNKCRQELEDKIKKLSMKKDELLKRLDDIASNRPDIEQIQGELEASREKTKELQATLNDMMARGEELAVLMHNGTKQVFDAQQEVLENVHNQLDRIHALSQTVARQNLPDLVPKPPNPDAE